MLRFLGVTFEKVHEESNNLRYCHKNCGYISETCKNDCQSRIYSFDSTCGHTDSFAELFYIIELTSENIDILVNFRKSDRKSGKKDLSSKKNFCLKSYGLKTSQNSLSRNLSFRHFLVRHKKYI